MRIDDHAIASRAFRRRVDLEPEDFESWSNLANALLRLGHKPRAFLALKEAIRAEYENWKVWENLCAVAIDVGAFNDVIFSFNRIFDLKKSFGDHEILNLVVRAVNENLLDFDNQPCKRMISPVMFSWLRLTHDSIFSKHMRIPCSPTRLQLCTGPACAD
eukprot:m.175032 g.175032  ORF g.175032 m.175032 type:complete len:160 (-) comp15332_c0_seq7:577-1056(-)